MLAIYALRETLLTRCPVTDGVTGSETITLEGYYEYEEALRLLEAAGSSSGDGDFHLEIVHVPSGRPVNELYPYAPAGGDPEDDEMWF